MDWPEQKVTIVEEDKSPLVRLARMQVLNDGVKQCLFQIPRLPADKTAQVAFTLKIERWHISPPPMPELFVFARKHDSKLRPFLGESPFIEIRNPLVKSAADGIELDESDTAWRQVETIYDWTRGKVHSDGTKPLKGALGALTSGTGDCEERTSLFVAMCRLKKIPARCVWIEGHAYPEFYLLDDRGHGHWIPCESLGGRNFGGIQRYDPILQKGDNFRMSQKSGAQRYVAPTASCMLGPGSGTPVIREIRENVNVDE
jgi:transglutaminase-like putative cysteine protease